MNLTNTEIPENNSNQDFNPMPITPGRGQGKKIVLFHPNPFSATRPYNGAPLPVLSISRVLDAEGYDVQIFHPVSHPDFEKDILKACEGAICFGVSSITGYQITEGRMVASLVRKKYPNLPIVWGGWHPSISPEETVKDDCVDLVVRGMGERTFPELVYELEQGNKDLSNILGLTWINQEGKVISNPDRPLEPLDNFPMIPWHLVEVERFLNNQEYGQRSLNYFTSYGCPHKCSFCVEDIVSKRMWSGQSPERTAEEIKQMVEKYNLDSIAILDSNFFTKKKRVKEFAELMIQKKVNIQWGNANGRVSTLLRYDEEIWELMKRSGLACILVGAESGDQETLDFMQKGTKAKQVEEVAEKCAKYDIKILCSYLVGFPWSKDPLECQQKVDKEISVTLDQIDRLIKIHARIRFFFAVYLPYPSTQLFDQARDVGMEIPEHLEDWSQFLIAAEDARRMKVKQAWISKEQAEMVLMLSTYMFFFLDPDSVKLVGDKIKNPLFKLVFNVAFASFKSVVTWRWNNKNYKLPVDFYLMNFLRKYAKLG